MKLSVKNTARLAVTAGLCASLTLGSLPVAAIATELDVVEQDVLAGEPVDAAAGTTDDETPAEDEAPTGNEATTEDEAAPEDTPAADAPVTDGPSAGTPAPKAAPASDEVEAKEAAPADAIKEADSETAVEGWVEDATNKTVTISSTEALEQLAKNVNDGNTYEKWTISLSANIDLQGKNWTPIGTAEHKFAGTFVGTGYAISNLVVNEPELEGAGLFGWLGGGKLQDVTIVNASVTGESRVAALVGGGYTGGIEGCVVKGQLAIKGHQYVGGISGHGYASIKNCTVEGAAGSSITGEYKSSSLDGDNVGGIIGFRAEGKLLIEGCSVSGLMISGVREVGGIAGGAYTGNTITGCSVKDIKLVCNAPYSYSYKQALAIGGLVGGYVKDSVGTLSNCTIDGVSFDVADPQMKAENHPILGLVTGGVRISSIVMGGDSSAVNVSDLNIKGNNTGMNGEQKMPGSSIVNATAELPLDGTGTAEDPYIISSVEELELFRTTVNTTGLTYEGQYLKVADGVEFDLSAEKWTSIGTSSNKFMGTFDGNSVTVKGLNDGGKFATGYSAFFGYINGATLKNIAFEDVSLSYGSGSKGALASNATGNCTIDSISVSGSIVGGDSTGGVLGKWSNSGEETLTIINCMNSATVTGKGKLGGVLGYAKSDDKTPNGKVVISGCSNTGDVTPTDNGGYAGGIAGMVKFATVSNCSNEGDINAYAVAGGIIGTIQQKDSIVRDCVNNGDVSSKTFAGGILGESASGASTFNRCANTGDVVAGPVAPEWWSSGTPGPMAGGIVGGSRADGDAFYNCYNGGDISASTDDATKAPYAAGITAYYSVYPIEACFNDGAVAADGGTAYQIGESKKWLQGATVPGGQTIKGCYFEADGVYYLSASNGTSAGTEQTDMTRGQLADALNTAGGVPGFWQAQNGSVQPDPLIPGAWDGDMSKVVVSVLNADGAVRENYTSLEEAVADVQDGETIQLAQNIELDTTLRFTGKKSVTLDLNGFKLSNSQNFRPGIPDNNSLVLINIETGASVTLTDSAKTKGLVQSDLNAAMICVRAGASMTVEDAVIDFADQNHGASNIAIQNQGTLVVEDGVKITSTEGGISTIGEGASITINGGEIAGVFYALTGNGALGGTVMTVNGGKLSATNGAGIYHPQDGILTLNGGEITGLTGVQMCAGTLIVPKDSAVKVTATGEDSRDSKTGNDGNIDDGAAISIINRDYPGGVPSADIKGGEFVSLKGETILAYAWDGDNKEHSDWDAAPEQIDVSGGMFNKMPDEAYLAEGFGLNKLPNGGYGVHEHTWSDEFKFNEDGHWHECVTEGCDSKSEVVPHSKGELKNAKDATCTEDGYTGDQVCECGYVLKKGEVIKALGHDWSKWSVTEPTCTKDGEKTRTCATCGEKETEVIKATGHTAEKWTGNKTDHWKECETCGEEFAIEAHDFGEWKVTKEPAATEKGEREHACKVCGKTVSEEIPALGEKPADKPGKGEGEPEGGELAQTGDASMLGVAATGIAGALAAVAGAVTRRRRK